MKTTNCEQCGSAISYEPFIWKGVEAMAPTKCNACHALAVEAEQGEINRQWILSAWEKVCPPLYRDTDIQRLPKAFQSIIRDWDYGARGVGFVGHPGMGKTRTALLMLRKQIEAHRICAYLTSTTFAEACVDKFSEDDEVRTEARELLMSARTAHVLLLDDLGKGKMTERAELELYALLEHRTSFMQPTIWTANSNGAQLRAAMSEERGAAILRRLIEFSTIL